MDSDQSMITLFSGHTPQLRKRHVVLVPDREIQKRKGRPCERPQVQVCENARSRLASNSTVYTSVAGVNFSKRLRLRFPQFKS